MDDGAVNVASFQDNNATDNVSNSYATDNPMRNSDVSNSNVSNSYASDNVSNNVSNSYASDKKEKIGDCKLCGNSFTKRTAWHVYCSDLCKVKAYELRTGKKFYKKKGV